jgi:hypothetical protein
MSDFSASIAAEYRSGYQQWRAGKPCGSKGDGRQCWPATGSGQHDAVRSWEMFVANVALERRAPLLSCAE